MHDPIPGIPVVTASALPVDALRAPLPIAGEEASSTAEQSAQLPDLSALCELLEPAISAVIARKARQRRYTP